MPFLRTLLTLFAFTIFSIPLALNSTDIYHSSGGLVRIRTSLNPHIVTGDPRLWSTVFVITSPHTHYEPSIDTSCANDQKLLYREWLPTGEDLSVIQIFFSGACQHPSARVAIAGTIFTDTKMLLPFVDINQEYASLFDLSDDTLTRKMRENADTANSFSWQISSPADDLESRLEKIHFLYALSFAERQSDLDRKLLDKRTNLTYLSPVAGFPLPENPIRIPGAGRPYRDKTTDGIHHGWDVMAPYGTPVRATADGVIVRVVSDWKWSDFDHIKQTNLSDDDRLTNLDIYRGNQVWLKMVDGNVVFYSHLSEIDPRVHVGSLVQAGERLWAIGKSGVPDKNYTDYHLHFAIQKNPHINGTDDPLKIMQWEYIGQNETQNEVLSDTRHLFRGDTVLTQK